jgi:hypothetical protein
LGVDRSRQTIWQRDQRDVGWNFQSLAALMPSGTVTDQDSVRASSYLGADLLQVLVHRLGIGDRHDDRGPDPATRADCAKQIDRVMTIVPHCGRPPAVLIFTGRIACGSRDGIFREPIMVRAVAAW